MQLKEARKRAGLTANQVAVALGVSTQNVYNWEAGSYWPEIGRLAHRFAGIAFDLVADAAFLGNIAGVPLVEQIFYGR